MYSFTYSMLDIDDIGWSYPQKYKCILIHLINKYCRYYNKFYSSARYMTLMIKIIKYILLK